MTFSAQSLEAVSRWSWQRIYLSVSSLLVLNTIAYVHVPEFAQQYRLMGPFTLVHENNLAVWWSTASLFAAALLAYQLAFARPDTRWAWVGLAFVLFCCSCDELGSLHERFGGRKNYLTLAPIPLAIVGLSLRRLWTDPRARRAVPLLVAGFGMFASVAIQERIEHWVDWPSWAVGLRGGIEEGSELFGMYLLLLAIVPQRYGPRGETRFRALVAQPQAMGSLVPLLALGFLVHVAVTLWVVPGIYDRRGDLTAVFPALAYFTLFAHAFWSSLDPAEPRRRSWALLSICFAIISAGQAYDLAKLIPRITEIVPGWFLFDGPAAVTVQVALLWIVLVRKRREPAASRRTLALGALAITVLMLATEAGAAVGPVIGGAFPLLLGGLLLDPPGSRTVDRRRQEIPHRTAA